MSDPNLIQCSVCGANNRVPADKLASGRVPVCGKCKSPLGGTTKPLIVTDANFASVVEQSSLPVLVDFWASWCGPCHAMAPVVDSLAVDLAGRVTVGKLNVDENPMTSARFDVRSIPTLLVFQGGREADRIVGAQGKSEITSRLAAILPR